ncbi:MAG: polyprenyl synthetase family protein [Verrucomicrobia bacterium]|nr:polyprenyl synthetase family protein [Verrucomicrobiota bacterium]
MTPLSEYLADSVQRIDQALDGYLPPETRKPAQIHKAMRYSLFAGGKRLRPVLTLAAAEACGGTAEEALPLACAVECIHTYSLIHDDLPAMDNDDYRRGRLTNHKVFGDATAILAGDALLTFAFELVAKANTWSRYDMRALVGELALGAGSQRLIAGQVADMQAEGRRVSPAQVQYIHECKTAALLATAVRFGAMSADAPTADLKAVTKFGRALGLAFQVIDDILDVTQTSEKLGKSAGKDIAAQKATYPAVFGLAKARKEADRLTKEALGALDRFGDSAARLRQLAEHLLVREF